MRDLGWIIDPACRRRRGWVRSTQPTSAAIRMRIVRMREKNAGSSSACAGVAQGRRVAFAIGVLDEAAVRRRSAWMLVHFVLHIARTHA
jgi:hypothetical protein